MYSSYTVRGCARPGDAGRSNASLSQGSSQANRRGEAGRRLMRAPPPGQVRKCSILGEHGGSISAGWWKIRKTFPEKATPAPLMIPEKWLESDIPYSGLEGSVCHSQLSQAHQLGPILGWPWCWAVAEGFERRWNEVQSVWDWGETLFTGSGRTSAPLTSEASAERWVVVTANSLCAKGKWHVCQSPGQRGRAISLNLIICINKVCIIDSKWELYLRWKGTFLPTPPPWPD